MQATWVSTISYNARDLGSISGLGRSPGEGHGNPLQYSCLENFINRGAWRATVPGIAELERTERPTLSLSSFHNEEITGCLSEITSPKSRISLNPPQKKPEPSPTNSNPSQVLFRGGSFLPDQECFRSRSFPRRRALAWQPTSGPAPYCCCCCLAAQSCPTLCDPMDRSLPGSSVHGIL